MKKILILCFFILVLTGCERPATVSNGSPINNANIPALATPDFQATSTTTLKVDETPAANSSSTPWPTLDVDQLPNPLPESMKGYELVSWQIGEEWNFTLITGTNRMKSFEELMSPESEISESGIVKITVKGMDQIKAVIERLPEYTEVLWSGMTLEGQVSEGTVYFAYPPAEMIDELKDFCEVHHINLVLLAEPGS